MNRTTWKYWIAISFFINIFSFFGFLSCFLFEISFSYLCFFPDFEFCFLFNIIVLGFKNPSCKTQFISKKWLCNITFFFINLCFAKCEKLSFFWGAFFCNFLVVFEKHYKIGILAHFSKQTFTKKWHFWKLLSGPSWKFLSGPSWVRLKKRQLGPDNNFQIFSAQDYPIKNVLKPLIYSVLFDNRCFIKKQTWTR